MLGNRNPSINPVLETKRDGYLAVEKEKREELLGVYRQYIAKTKHLHANLLFTTRHGRSILSAICQHVTFINPSVMNNSWRDLAAALGYSDVTIKCFNNLQGNIYDPTEVLLICFAASKSQGTLGCVLQALLELGFFPALHQAQKYIDLFLAEVETLGVDILEVPNITEDRETKNIVKSANFNPYIPVIFDLSPPKDVTIKDVSCKSNNTIQQEVTQRARPQPQKHKQYCKFVLLSYASDGATIASRVASVLRATTNKKGFPIGVSMLCENQDIAISGQIVAEIVSKMDFVIPVLTDGYFAALKCPDSCARLVDERYIQFIHDILVSKYIHNQCVSNVRPVIPTSMVSSIHSRPEFIYSSIFHAWRCEDELDALARGIVKSYKSRILL